MLQDTQHNSDYKILGRTKPYAPLALITFGTGTTFRAAVTFGTVLKGNRSLFIKSGEASSAVEALLLLFAETNRMLGDFYKGGVAAENEAAVNEY